MSSSSLGIAGASPLSRRALLRCGAGAGLSLAGLGLLARPAAASPPSDADLAYLRLLVATELLKGDIHARGLAAGKLSVRSKRTVAQARADDRAHYTGLAALLQAAGQQPATADDVDFSYPKGSFATDSSILALAAKITTLAQGAYVGALGNLQTAELRVPLAQIAANEAQQVSALAQLRGRAAICDAFAPALRIDAVSAALDEYES